MKRTKYQTIGPRGKRDSIKVLPPTSDADVDVLNADPVALASARSQADLDADHERQEARNLVVGRLARRVQHAPSPPRSRG